MYLSTTRQPHLLPPAAYCSAAQAAFEAAHLANCWHFVATLSQLAKPGSFVTCTLVGQPVQVRRFEQSIVAVSNVCAHRHCLLSSLPAGCSPTLRCQYHGWEYDEAGHTRRIPEAKLFAPFPENPCDRERLETYRVETLGQLVFVNLSPTAPSLETLAGQWYAQLVAGLASPARVSLRRTHEHNCNWKVPVENTLEAYHVDAIHESTFGAAPSEERSLHQKGPTWTSLTTDLPFDRSSKLATWFQSVEAIFVRHVLRKQSTASYTQLHIFPNLLFSLTDTLTLAHVVEPLAPTRSKSMILQFSHASGGWFRQTVARAWGWIAGTLTSQIFSEDFRLYPSIQAGLSASKQRGVLGRSEDRIFEFQKFLTENGWIDSFGEAISGNRASTASHVLSRKTHDLTNGNPPE